MDEASTVGQQGMLSCAGIEKPKLQELCQQAAAKEGGNAVCVIANELFPKGYSCSGTGPAISHLKELADNNGALQAKILKTGGAFHTSLMNPAKQRLAQALEEELPNMKSPKTNVYMNVSATCVGPNTSPK